MNSKYAFLAVAIIIVLVYAVVQATRDDDASPQRAIGKEGPTLMRSRNGEGLSSEKVTRSSPRHSEEAADGLALSKERIAKLSESETLAALNESLDNGAEQSVVDKLFARLAQLNPLLAIKLASETVPPPNASVWLSETQVEIIINKHGPAVREWICTFEEKRPAEKNIKMALLTRLTGLFPELAVDAFVARSEKFGESDMGRLPVALNSILRNDPQKSLDICFAKFSDPDIRDRYVENMIMLGFSEDLENAVEAQISQVPDRSMREAAIRGLIAAYKRSNSPRAEHWQAELDRARVPNQ